MRRELTTTMLLVTGIADNACRERVLAALERVAGVLDVHVSLFRATASVTHRRTCPVRDLVRAVESAGFHAVVHRPGGGGLIRLANGRRSHTL